MQALLSPHDVEGGLLEPREEGRWIDYRLRAEAFAQLQGWLGQLAASCGRQRLPLRLNGTRRACN